MANPVGRPSLYKPEYCDQVIEHMSQGRSYLAFAGTIGVTFDTLYQWEKVHTEFSEAKKIGLAKSLNWWDSIGLYGLKDKERFNTTNFIFQMKNRFRDYGWSDKQEIEQRVTTTAESMTPEKMQRLKDMDPAIPKEES